MQSKYFFVDKKEQIEEEHKTFETHLEQKELPTVHCDHKGKVQAIPGGLKCQCGAGWQGKDLHILLKLFNGVQ
jgi:hypothetical protein